MFKFKTKPDRTEKNHFTPRERVIAFLFVMVLLEFGTMIILSTRSSMSVFNTAMADILIFSLICLPVSYFMVFKPMNRLTMEGKKALDELTFSENLMRYIIEHSRGDIAVLDKNLKYIYVSKSFLKDFNINDNIIGRHHHDVLADLPERWKEINQKVLGGEICTSDNDPYVRADGTTLWNSRECFPWFESEGSIGGIVIYVEIINQQKQAEEKLLKLSSAIEQTIDSVTITDLEGKIEYVNHAFEVITGYSSEEALGKTPRILKSGLKGEEYYSRMWKSILAGEVFRAEVVNKKKNGELFHEQKTISPIFDKNRNITHFVGTGVDISEQKRTVQALLDSEKLYRGLFDNMLNGFAYCKMIFEKEYPTDFIYVAVNKSFEIHTGLKNVTGKRVSEVIPGIRESDAGLFEIYGKVALTGQPETIEIYVEGLEMWFSISVYSPHKGYFVAVFDVITSRKNAEEVMRQSEAKFRKLINSLPDPVLVVDTIGQITYCNQIAMKTFNYAIDEMIGCSIETLIPRHLREPHVGLRNEFILNPFGLPMGEGKELMACRKDGSEFPTEIMLQPIEINNNQFVLAIVRDITDRKSAEKELIMAKEKAEESDRLKSAFLANMSHEVRTPLNSIIGFSKLLADSDIEEEVKQEFIQHIVTNGNNLSTIISDIMDISKIESGEIMIHKHQMDAGEFISNRLDQFSLQAQAKNIELKLILTDRDDKTLLDTDPDRLGQIFNILISNALKFTAKGSIEIGYHPYGTMAEFFVRDTGIGISEEYHKKIFDHFRQVEESKTRTYGGNGLGLAISKNLVELMGGKIWLESEPGKGSTFYFTIPRVEKAPAVLSARY